MAYDQDKLAVPQPSPAAENKFDGVENPDRGEKADVNLTLTPNQFPHETGSDTIPSEDLYWLGG